ncbi:hypothetical protein NQ318_017765 [Aromia moschata]|uniref:Uncharacterized protein n=1 Tax=Aromia moschata TaxID=1265417 RepID=A0AAV8XTX8_9CUCU|nr:hypothetical protein NQ318_017765 [Aromia moschata]
MIVLSTTEELHKYISVRQLTPDLGGTLQYNHEEWIEQRIELEKFSAITQQVSNALDEFTRTIEETELPNNVDSTQQKNTCNDDKFVQSSDTISNVFAVERLLVQLEETEKTFDEFWQEHSTKLRHCLELRRFEQDFRELQSNFDTNLKTVSEMTEVGETVSRVDINKGDKYI